MAPGVLSRLNGFEGGARWRQCIAPKYLVIASNRVAVPGPRGCKGSRAHGRLLAYGVSIVTASRAIQVLQDKGLIRTVDRSGSFVTPSVSVADGRECYAIVQRSTPGPWFQASLAFSQAGFSIIERQDGVRFEVDRFHFDEATRPADLLRQARRAAEAGVGWCSLHAFAIQG